MTITAVTTRPLSSVVLGVTFGVALIVAGCSSTDGNQPAQPATSPATTATSPAASALRPECRAVFDDAQTLVTKVGGLATNSATVDDVRTAANALASSFDHARNALGPEAQAGLDQAGQALQKFQTALSAQPVDTAALRRAANDIVAGLGNAVTVCSASTPASPPTT